LSHRNFEEMENEFKIQEVILETKNKILLWRQFYKTVSVCVL